MRGLYIEGGDVTLRHDLPEPEPGPGECLVEVLRVGVCATDLALQRGYMGFEGVPGHEFVGRALDGPLAGRRVVGEINAACGRCARCRAGLGRHCAARTVLGILDRGGAFAERLALPEANLHEVPDGLSTDAATFTEPLAAAFEILEQVAVPEDAAVLVAGDGRLGLLCAHALERAGARVTVAGRHPERARLLPEGAVHRTGLLEGGDGPRAEDFDLAVEATGDPAVLGRLLGAVRPRGTIVLKTTAEREAVLDLAPLVVNEITLVGSRCGPFAPALEALASGAVDPTPLIEARYDLRHGVEALRRAGAGGILKVLVEVAPG